MLDTESGKAVFLDKDGTLIEDVPYNVDPAQIRMYPGVLQSLGDLSSAGYMLIIISNQSGVALGRFSEMELSGVESHLKALMAGAGITLSGFYFCPHHPKGTVSRYSFQCDCRKPETGMLLRASRELDINLSKSWMIGDILDDVEAGRRSGCKTILVHRGNETKWAVTPRRRPHFIVADFPSAAAVVVSHST